MRRLLIVIASIFVGFVALTPAYSQGEAPGISLGLKLDKATYYPGVPVLVSLSVKSTEEVITNKGFMNTEFYLSLQFHDEKGRIITSDALAPTGSLTPKPPKVFTSGAALLQGAEVEIVPSGWVVSFDSFDAYGYYPLEGRSGRFWVEAKVQAKTYTAYQTSSTGTWYATTSPEADQTKWFGSLKSNAVPFTIVGDADGDGYYYPEAYGGNPADCDDTNPAVHPGAVEIAGDGLDNDCNPSTADVPAVEKGTVQVLAQKHTVGTGHHPGSTKEAIADLPLRVYSKSAGSCVSNYGVSWQHYPTIWQSCPNPEGHGVTGADGVGLVSVPVGNYIVIGRYDPNPAVSGDDIYMGVSVGQVDAGAIVEKYLQLIVKASGKKVPGKYTRRKGSDLLIIEPEYVEWDGTQETYPFVFESEGDWSVATSVDPPEGFVADYDALSTQVDTEVKAVQFTITDVGSKWTDTGVTFDLKHENKKEKIKHKIGVKLSKKLAKEKKLDVFGRKLGKEKGKKKP